MSEETTQTPAPSGDSQDSKKQTVRISLPPKPAAAPTIKIAVPPAGAAKTAADSGKAASTIKIPVPPKTAKPGVGVPLEGLQGIETSELTPRTFATLLRFRLHAL